MPKLLEGLKTWLQSMNDTWASEVAVDDWPTEDEDESRNLDRFTQ